MGRTIFEGPIASKTKETDGQLWVPASQFDKSFVTGVTWPLTRVAQGNYKQIKTADATIIYLVLALNPLFKKIGQDPTWDAIYSSVPSSTPSEVAHDIRGVQIKSIDLVYGIGTTALDSHVATFNRTVYANNVAPVVSQPGGATVGALATATQGQPYVTNQAPTTIYVLSNTTLVTDSFEVAVDGAAGSIYDLYGAFVNFNYNLL